MMEFLDKKEEICSKILEFRNELFEQILDPQSNNDPEFRFELYKLELTLERAVCITALNDAIKEYKKVKNDCKNIKAIDDFCYKVIECNERLFSLLEEELDLLDERDFDGLRTL